MTISDKIATAQKIVAEAKRRAAEEESRELTAQDKAKLAAFLANVRKKKD